MRVMTVKQAKGQRVIDWGGYRRGEGKAEDEVDTQ